MMLGFLTVLALLSASIAAPTGEQTTYSSTTVGTWDNAGDPNPGFWVDQHFSNNGENWEHNKTVVVETDGESLTFAHGGIDVEMQFNDEGTTISSNKMDGVLTEMFQAVDKMSQILHGSQGQNQQWQNSDWQNSDWQNSDWQNSGWQNANGQNNEYNSQRQNSRSQNSWSQNYQGQNSQEQTTAWSTAWQTTPSWTTQGQNTENQNSQGQNTNAGNSQWQTSNGQNSNGQNSNGRNSQNWN